MRFTPGALLLMLLAFSLSPVHGVLETNNTNLKCKCILQTFNFFPIHLIDRLQIIPRGRGCPNTEIIVSPDIQAKVANNYEKFMAVSSENTLVQTVRNLYFYHEFRNQIGRLWPRVQQSLDEEEVNYLLEPSSQMDTNTTETVTQTYFVNFTSTSG